MRADYITEIHDLLRPKPKHGSESYRDRINFLRDSRHRLSLLARAFVRQSDPCDHTTGVFVVDQRE